MTLIIYENTDLTLFRIQTKVHAIHNNIYLHDMIIIYQLNAKTNDR